ncbi:MAG: prepilin-type N-terminal cleavage/methylation domain-containing protein [Desulfitobacteriaceae bacterium]|nr:prepilin-type N-terminal cleavage/methylation domain-containing protein [Desulfitobacteriaceae bacterium]MDI6878025.1 prepilin-type N-terminal cleavage/methylation domain-containing protein [Desulfitobacteriaceae bacterium]MDI6914196.1 prepilin-type N-terminal cleavage/methylation domain-containing protein [Desulfitobacteriaceae bacterium]
MQKRRNEDGFTLIELMIVIAVIGILAVVLVPRIGSIKTQAKGAGIDTNVRMVQGYVQSKASRWADQSFSQAKVAQDILDAFNNTTNPDEKIKNPYSASSSITSAISTVPVTSYAITDALQVRDVDDGLPLASGNPEGSIVVLVPNGNMNGNSQFIIQGYNNKGAVESTVTITP